MTDTEPYAAPVGPGALRQICDEPDDGRRNWFVTLGYWDLSRQTAAYTHALDHPIEGVAEDPGPEESGDELSGDEQALALLDALYDASSGQVVEADRESHDLVPVGREEPERAPRRLRSKEAKAHVAAVIETLTRLSHVPAAPRAEPRDRRTLNANFCTFASWSSLTLGRDIRNVRMPRRFDRLSSNRVRRSATAFVVDARRLHGMQLARLLGLGQRVVLWEVGYGLQALFIVGAVLDELEAVKGLEFGAFTPQDRTFTDAAMDELVGVIACLLAAERVPEGARGLHQVRTEDLAQGLASYHLARCAARQAWRAERSDKGDAPRLLKSVAELVLRGNILIGAYEQRRVDQLLRYQVEEFASDFFLERSGVEASELSGEGRWRGRLGRRVRDELDRHVPQAWSRFFTDQILVFWAGDELLRLGRDLPFPPRSSTFFPPELQILEDEWLRSLWRRYDHSYGDGHGTQSRIWSVLPDRMNYIVNFMRSRAQSPGLWRPPFDKHEERCLRMGHIPGSGNAPSA